MKLFGSDLNQANSDYFSKGAQLEYYKERFFALMPPEEVLFPKYLREDQSVLDLGCGAGRTTFHIKKVTERVIGVDLSEVLIASAQANHPGVDFRVMDAGDLKFADGSFDVVVFSNNGLCYVHPEEKRLKAIREIRRVLKPGGIYIFSSFNRFRPLALYALVNFVVTKLFMGFCTNYTIHLTRHGVTVNYETSPAEETKLFEGMGFELLDQVPMKEKVGKLGYEPDVLTYYAFRKR
ncbi:MAG TPA: hypothetical protein DCZ75_15235 [Geobacter sp.]|nr:hypothetical protein [Geobacter sp.]